VPDAQIHPIGVKDAPADYVVPDSAELLLKGVYARFDGSGAAGSFKPLVRIISDAGSTVIEYVSDTTIAAGASADASWFPHVGGAAAAAASGSPVFARAWNDGLSGDPFQTVNAGATNNASFAHAETTDSAVVSFRTVVHTNDTADLKATGTYIMYCGSHWDVTDVALTSLIQESGAQENAFPHTPINPNTAPTFGDGVGSAQSQDFAVCHVTTTTISERVLLGNQLGAAHSAEQCYFVIVYVPTA
jgi:hypothetical protein